MFFGVETPYCFGVTERGYHKTTGFGFGLGLGLGLGLDVHFAVLVSVSQISVRVKVRKCGQRSGQ